MIFDVISKSDTVGGPAVNDEFLEKEIIASMQVAIDHEESASAIIIYTDGTEETINDQELDALEKFRKSQKSGPPKSSQTDQIPETAIFGEFSVKQNGPQKDQSSDIPSKKSTELKSDYKLLSRELDSVIALYRPFIAKKQFSELRKYSDTFVDHCVEAGVDTKKTVLFLQSKKFELLPGEKVQCNRAQASAITNELDAVFQK